MSRYRTDIELKGNNACEIHYCKDDYVFAMSKIEIIYSLNFEKFVTLTTESGDTLNIASDSIKVLTIEEISDK